MCYDKDIFENNPYLQHFICPIGQQIMENPVKINCENLNCASHSYCKACIVQWLLTDRDKRCPICKTRIDFDLDKLPKDYISNNIINEFNIKCVNYENNCCWIGKLKDLENHIKICDYQNINCPNVGCREKFLRSNLNNHNLKCDYLLVKCLQCNNSIKNIEIENHMVDQCEMNIIECSKCKLSIIRKNFESHVLECLEEEIKCSNESCEEKIQRKLQNNHNEECKYFLIKCKLCNIEYPRNILDIHIKEKCPELIILCDQCQKPLKNKEKRDHYFECPQTIVDCEYKGSSGCKVQYKIKDRDEHMKLYLHEHMMGSLNKLYENQEKHITKKFYKKMKNPQIIIKLDKETHFTTMGFNCFFSINKVSENNKISIFLEIKTNETLKILLNFKIDNDTDEDNNLYDKIYEVKGLVTQDKPYFEVKKLEYTSLDEFKQKSKCVKNNEIVILVYYIKITRIIDNEIRNIKFIKN